MLSVIGGLIVLVIIISVASPKSNIETTTNTTNSSSETKAPEASTPAEKMTISNTSYADQGYGISKVVGEIKNNDSGKHSATLKATFYDADGKILGTASGAVNDVASGETKTFELMTTDEVAGYATMKVAVDTLL